VIRTAAALVVLATLLVACAQESGPPDPPDPLPTHPAQLAPLSVDDSFPRFHPDVLASAGYPDHRHVYGYPGYQPPVADDGATYGIHSLARGTQLLPREGLEIASGEVRYRHLHLRHGPEFEAVGVMPVVEVFDWAQREISELLGHEPADTLHLVNPVDLDEYRARTGHEFHRLYRRDGSTVIMEPAKVLFARGLALHAAFHAVATWELDGMLGDQELPRWFTEGLASYLAEDGVHFLSYVLMFRDDGPVILTPEATEVILSGAPDPDKEVDKLQYRTAGYSAFLMMWELVENRGGLSKIRRFLHRVRDGEAADEACDHVWGHDLAGLARELDPTTRPEPVGEAVQARQPGRPPAS